VLLRFIALSVLVLTAVPSLAQAASARALVEAGAVAYVKDGAAAAVKVWLKGSALEGNTQAVSQANNLRQVEDFYGKPIGFDFIKESTISPRSKMVLLALNYEKGILYARMQVYQLPSGEWVNTEFKFHTESSQLFPLPVLYGQ
jgi:hypothetical protein